MDLRSQAVKGLNLNIHRLAHRIDTLTNSILKEAAINITNSQYLILKSIFVLENPSQKEIASYLGITPAAVSRHINILKDKKYIEDQNPNAKSSKLKLTKEGTALFQHSLITLQAKMRDKVAGYEHLSELIQKSLEEERTV